MTLTLDRIEIEGAGSDPVALARALLDQTPGLDGRVSIDEIARALDIVSIEIAPLFSIEACLQCDALKSHGQIVVNARSSPQRQRFSIGHELGHFLNERHVPSVADGFACSRRDMAAPEGEDRHIRQEREANAFAIEVLAPAHLLQAHLKPTPELDHVLAIAKRFEISREAAARRYVQCHRDCLAAVFSHDGKIRYVEKSEGFPSIVPWTNDPHGPLPAPPGDGSPLTGLDEVSAQGWLTYPDRSQLFAQTLYQREGHAITLLTVEQDDSTTEEIWAPPRFRR
ncbi:MAG: ImmA/IrrE family metallo-endopeptidase [Paracoccaceae bacterium]|nr:ImmA/IrrE family metallo-endopeptidase [Paracoccaceae bacterium]